MLPSSPDPSNGTIKSSLNGGTKNTLSSHSGMIRIRRPALDPSDLLVTSTAMKNSEEKQGGHQKGGGGVGPGSSAIDGHSLVRSYHREDKQQPQPQQQDEEQKDSQQDEQNTSQNGSFVGSSEYVSPEVLRNQPASTGSDMWALGCIIYKLYTGIAYRTDRAHIIYTLSTHYQHTLQHTLSLHSLHPPSQPTLSTHPLHPPSPPTHANDTGRSPFLEDGSEYLTFQNIMSHADGRSELQYPDTIPWGE